MKNKSLLGVLLVLSLATGCTQSSQNSQGSADSGSSGSSGSSDSSGSSGSSDSSGSTGGSALDDCQAYQDGYNTMRYSDFLQFEWDAFTSGGATEFKSEEFRELWTSVQNGDFPTWDDVGYVVYELCWDAADFEITIPIVEESTNPAPPVETVQVPDIIGGVDGDVETWLFQNGYKFVFDVKSTGFNPKLSCLLSGNNLILDQNPRAGTQVNNTTATRLTAFVNCES